MLRNAPLCGAPRQAVERELHLDHRSPDDRGPFADFGGDEGFGFRGRAAGWQRVELGASRLAPGLYFVRMTQGARMIARKVCLLD